MSCRETSVGSAFTSWARFVTGKELSDSAVSATFHRLKHVYFSRPEEDQKQYSHEDYVALLNRQEHRVRNNYSLSDKERERILARLQKAREEDDPENAIIYSLMNLVPAARNRVASQQQFIREISERTEENYDDVAQRFHEFANAPREDRLPISEDDISAAADRGLPRDKGTVNAVLNLESEALHFEVARAKKAPRRIIRQEIETDTTYEYPITEYGYDPRNQRLEIVVTGHNGEPQTHAYTNIPPSLMEEYRLNPNTTWEHKIRGNPAYQYASINDSILAGAAPHCPICGQFADTTHSCDPRKYPVSFSNRENNREQWERTTVSTFYISINNEPIEHKVSVPIPKMDYIQESVDIKRPIHVSFSEYLAVPNPNNNTYQSVFYENPYNVSGTVTLIPQDDDEVRVNTKDLMCNCPRYSNTGYCEHIKVVSDSFTTLFSEPLTQEQQEEEKRKQLEEAIRLAETRIERIRQEAELTNWANHPQEFVEAQKTWWIAQDTDEDSSNVSYSNNIEFFVEDIQEALNNTNPNGSPRIPYTKENVLDGMCSRESGVAFGVEIEYDLPPGISWREQEEIQEQIGEALYASNITSTDWLREAHSAGSEGYVDVHVDDNGRGTWSWEEDGSCAGEIVSPAMYDEPETWEKLEKVLTILKKHGAHPSINTGAHVHVGTGLYEGDPQAYTELARLTTQHEDVLYRLASDPVQGTHRRNGYSQPLPRVPKDGFRDVSALNNWQRTNVGRYAVVNFSSCSGSQYDHAEFRIFDGTLDPGSMQAQIKLAVATTYAAKRIANEGITTQRRKEPWGSHVARKPDLLAELFDERTAEKSAEDSETTRSFLDTIFKRREDKKQLAAIYAYTNWSVPNSNSY